MMQISIFRLAKPAQHSNARNRSLPSDLFVKLSILMGMMCVALPQVVAQDPDEPANAPEVLAAAEARILTLAAEPAREPFVASRYRLYPSHRDLKPGAAAPHFTRAVLLFLEKTEQERQQWNQFQEAHEAGVECDIDKELKPFESVFIELVKFGQCEDLTWDDRLRDLNGKELADALMPESRYARELAKLVRMKCLGCLEVHDFDRAFECIRIGYRLAEFVGQGDSIMQPLVGIAICGLFEECLRSAISTPGCPNLYWAIASIPKPLIQCRKSVQIELANMERVVPVLADAETLQLTSEQWSERWAKDIREFDALFVNPDQNEREDKLEKSFSWTREHGIAEAKKCLVTNGKVVAEINAMPVEKLIALASLYEVRRLSFELSKGFSLPMSMRTQSLKEGQLKLEQYAADHPNSIASAVMYLLAPIVDSVGQAETRSVYFLHRLMNVEALRMHMAVHGDLPNSLSELDPVQTVPNPFDGSEFAYDVKEDANSWTATLNGKSSPADPAWQWPITVKLPKRK